MAGGMPGRVGRAVADTTRGVTAAVRSRPGTFAGAAAVVLVLSILVPPLLLSVVRKPVDYVTFNPWLKRLPAERARLRARRRATRASMRAAMPSAAKASRIARR